MNTRTIAILLVAALAAATLCFLIAKKAQNEMTATLPAKPFAAAPVNDSLKLVVRDGKGAETIVEKIEGQWVVPAKSGYPADFSKVAGLLTELVELKPAQNIPGGETALERFNLQPGEALEIQVFTKDAAKPLMELRSGKAYKEKEMSDQERQMAMMMGRDIDAGPKFAFLPALNAVVVINAQLSQASPNTRDWLDKDFPKISDLKSLSLADSGKPQWTMTRKDAKDEWTVEGPTPDKMEFDKQTVSSVVGELSWLKFSDIGGKAAKFEHPQVLTAESFDGTKYVFTFGEAKGGKIQATLEVVSGNPKLDVSKWSKLKGWTYLFDRASFDKLLVSREKLFKAKPEPVKPAEVKPAGDAAAKALPGLAPKFELKPMPAPVKEAAPEKK